MNKDRQTAQRPTFKRTLRRINMTSIVITMTLVWLMLCVVSVISLKQYAQKNLELTGATLSHTIEAALVFRDETAATDTLATLGKQGQFARADVFDKNSRLFARWIYESEASSERFNLMVSHWLFPRATTQPVIHNGEVIGQIRLTARDSLISHFIWTSLAVLTTCILLATAAAMAISRHLHADVVSALQNIADVAHDVRTNRNFSRRVPDERIEEFHHFAQDFNSLLDEMAQWQDSLQAKNDLLLQTAMHDPLTGLPNRAAFRTHINALMADPIAKSGSALLFMDGDDFKYINDTWGHAAGDYVLIETALRLVEFSGKQHRAFRLGGDEFAILLGNIRDEQQVQRLCGELAQHFIPEINMRNGHATPFSLSIGYALTCEHESVETLLEQADKKMYLMKNQRAKTLTS
ncbi:diguanylate cyclase DgcN [Enterobacter sp. CC120223-11]|uniref:diguanylate cyclase DgcN n=1 Tax=Enterobacter sp. CC120223-11 TaxID=1378073 RepID=UPI000BD8EB82|nr:diguanylate cyclase DgcN [Enterobacter sp. CC120223-11]SNY78804.1 diguanylate cyclase (GGDEF) domain-containing protein [Enterobacter sp. CC120223-11]